MYEVQEPNEPPEIGFSTVSRHQSSDKALEVAKELAFPGRTVQVFDADGGNDVWTVTHTPGEVLTVTAKDEVIREPGEFLIVLDSRYAETTVDDDGNLVIGPEQGGVFPETEPDSPESPVPSAGEEA